MEENQLIDLNHIHDDEEPTPYRAVRFRITKEDELYPLCDDWSFKVKNLYNVGNFYIRQAMTGTQKKPEDRYENEKRIIDDVNRLTEEFNAERKATFDKKGPRFDKKGRPLVFRPYNLLDADHWFIPTRNLRTILRRLEDPTYMALPSHIAQETLVLLDKAWNGYFKSLAKWKTNPELYTGKPEIPGYLPKDGRQTVYITNTTSLLKTRDDGTHYVTFPKSKLIYDMKDAPLPDGVHKQTRIVPDLNCYWLEVVMEVEEPALPEELASCQRVAFIDLGVSNFAVVTSNVGTRPLIIRGGYAKAANQFYNKQTAHYTSILTKGQDPQEGQKTSHKIRNIVEKRNRKIHDFMHKASRIVVDWAVENDIEAIVVGHNHDWKRNVNIGSVNNQNFISIPYCKFITMLDYKARDKGILVVEGNEAYTSKSSFLDEDPIPDCTQAMQGKPNFSGKRVKRGWYQSPAGGLNSDVNGSANIGRKNCPHLEVTDEWKKGVKETPKSINPVRSKKLPEHVKEHRKQVSKEKSKPKSDSRT